MTTTTDPNPSLVTAVREIETHVAGAGWDQPARLYALVDTPRLIASEPGLAEALGLTEEVAPGSLTPIEQEGLATGELLEELLETIVWPDQVDGCAAVVERLVLPPEVDSEIPNDAEAAAEFARTHPLRQEVRIVAGVLRDGSAHCALRLRSHDDEASVAQGADLVPGLVQLLAATFEPLGEGGSMAQSEGVVVATEDGSEPNG